MRHPISKPVSDNARESCMHRIMDLLREYVDQKDTVNSRGIERIAVKIERGIYGNGTYPSNKYKDRYRKVISNMNPRLTPNAPVVLENIMNGQWPAEELADMDHTVLNPEKTRRIQKEKESDARITKNIHDQKMAKKSIFRCGRCKSDKVDYIQIQTRSADEGMTIKCTCLNCNNVWKMS